VDIYRYQARHPARPLPPNLETSQIDQHEDRAAELEQDNHHARMQRVLAMMSSQSPGTSYRVFLLRCIEGRTVQEVAEELHLSARQVHYRCHRMKQKFRHFYEQDLRAGDVGLQ
jgi:DNA-directed RNA polymerase specialized sigma24 family protein